MKPIEAKVKAGLGLIAGLLLVVIVIAHVNSAQVRRWTQLAARGHAGLEALASIETTMVDVESAIRGLAISGELEYLQALAEARVNIPVQLAILNGVTNDTPQLVQPIEELNQLVSQQLEFREEIVRIAEERGLDAARERIASGEGRRGMQGLRAAIDDLRVTEKELLSEREHARDAADRDALGILLLLSAVMLGLLFAGYRFIRGYATQRTQYMRNLETARAFAESVVDTVSQPLVVLDSNLLPTRANRTFLETFGTPGSYAGGAETAMGDDFQGHPPWTDPDVARRLHEVMEKGEPLENHEIEYLSPQGRKRILLLNARKLYSSNYHSDGILVAVEDITLRKEGQARLDALNSALRQRAADLETANKELEAFSYSVSHDLRAPLRHISGFSDLLVKHAGGALDETGQRYLRTIVEATRRMGNLIDDLLAFSRMGRTAMRPQPVDLDVLVRECQRDLEGETQGRNVVWRIGTLPQVEGDLPMLRQVFLNLIANAVKYTKPRDPAVIEISHDTSSPREVVIQIRDNGVGFDMRHIDKLFGVFQRLHRAEEFDGTGIGLATVRRVVRRHGGRTWAEGKPGEGATFYVALPANKAAAEPLTS